MKINRWLYGTALLLPVLWGSSAMAQGRWQGPPDRGWGPQSDRGDRWGQMPPGEPGGRIFDALDANNDGRIDRNEFIDRASKFGQRMQQMRQGFGQGAKGMRDFRGPMGRGMAGPQAGMPGANLPEMIEKAVRDALRTDREKMMVRPPEGPTPRAYGFRGFGPGGDRDAKSGGRGPGFDRPRWGMGGGGQCDQPPWAGRGAGRPQWGRGGPGADLKSQKDKGRDRELGGPDLRGPVGQPGGAMRFRMLDANSDGKIQKAELQRVRDILSEALAGAGEEELTKEQIADIARKLHGGDLQKLPAGKAQEDRPRKGEGSRRGPGGPDRPEP